MRSFGKHNEVKTNLNDGGIESNGNCCVHSKLRLSPAFRTNSQNKITGRQENTVNAERDIAVVPIPFDFPSAELFLD